VAEHDLHIDGVVHVGAHTGEEALIYDQLGLRPIWWIEANPDVIPILRANLRGYAGQHVIEALVLDPGPWAVETDVPFHITNYDGMSSSVYNWGTHTQFSPDTVIEKTITLKSTTLDVLDEEYDFSDCNLLNIDVEGAGLRVLYGAQRILEHVQYLYLEIQTDNVYDGAPKLSEMTEWLIPRGFEMRDLGAVEGQGWGDALWIRK
jgi:FkbM family methyltransferase